LPQRYLPLEDTLTQKAPFIGDTYAYEGAYEEPFVCRGHFYIKVNRSSKPALPPPAPFPKIAKLAFVTMDLRLILVAAPILLAASWAVFHIGRAAVGQLQLFIKRA